MKKQTLIIITVVLVLPIIMSNALYRKTSGGHAASTGAPGEPTCANAVTGCHADASINSGTGINTLIYPVSDSTYTAGKTYTVTVQVNNPGISKFGFELVALKDAGNTNIGTLTTTDANRTQLITATINSSLRTYITHKTNGTPATPSAGNNSWSFKWKAPASDVGAITFYYVTNNTNNSGTNAGDALYFSSFKIKPATTNSITEIIDEDNITASFNKSNNIISVNYNLKSSAQISLCLYDMQGKKIQSMESTHKSAGENSDKLEVPSDISTAIYSLGFMINDKTISKKIFIQ